MLREYAYLGATYQFIEGDAPEGAVLVDAKDGPKPANKRRVAPANKGGKPSDNSTSRKSSNPK